MIQITNINTSTNGNTAFVKLCINGTEEGTASLNDVMNEIIDFRVDKNELRREISVTEFANEARISRQAVVKMISGGRLKAQKVGEQYTINSDELVRYLKSE